LSFFQTENRAYAEITGGLAIRTSQLLPLIVLATLAVAAPVCAQHPNAFKTGVEIAGFEGDVYSALNLQGQEAQQFGRFFSSALYGLAVGDAYVQMSDGDTAGAISTITSATRDFTIGLTPWGAPYAALKLVSAAPPAIMKSLMNWKVGNDFAAYQRVRTEPKHRLPEDPLEFTSDRFKAWRSQARADFEQVWVNVRPYGAFNHYEMAKAEIIKQRLSKFGYWDSWFSSDYKAVKKQKVTDKEVADWTFARWEATVVAGVLTTYVPKRIEAAQRKLRNTTVRIVLRLTGLDGAPADIEKLEATSGGPFEDTKFKGNVVTLSALLGDLSKQSPSGRIRLNVALKNLPRPVPVDVPMSLVMDRRRWKQGKEFGESYIRADVGTIKIKTGPREAKVQTNTGATQKLRGSVGSVSIPEADLLRGQIELKLDPGLYVGRLGGIGADGETISRPVFLKVPLASQGQPAVASVDLSPKIEVAKDGSLGAIRSALRANAAKLEACEIGPDEYGRATGLSIMKAEGTVKLGGVEKAVSTVVREELAKTNEQLTQKGQTNIGQRARALTQRIDTLRERLPEDYRNALSSAAGLRSETANIVQSAHCWGRQFPYGPTAAQEIALEWAKEKREEASELLNAATSVLAPEVRSIQREVPALLDEYMRQWALVEFADRPAAQAISALSSDPRMRYWVEVVELAEELQQEGPVQQIDAVIGSIESAMAAREADVARVKSEHDKLVSALDSYRTVTLTDAARIASVIGACERLQGARDGVMQADGQRRLLEDPEKKGVHATAAIRFAELIRGAEATFALPEVQKALADLGAPAAKTGTAAPVAARVAAQAYRLAAPETRLQRALVMGSELRTVYNNFVRANRSLLSDGLITRAMLLGDSSDVQRPNPNWFSGGLSASNDKLRAAVLYDVDKLVAVERDTGAKAGNAQIRGAELATAAAELIRAVKDDEQNRQALNGELSALLSPYVKAARGTGGSDAQLCSSLTQCPEARSQFTMAWGRAQQDGRAPFHIEKLSEDTKAQLADADAAFAGKALEYHRRVAANIDLRTRRVKELEGEITAAWEHAAAIGKFLFEADLEKALQAAADLGEYSTGSKDLYWPMQYARIPAPGVPQANDKGNDLRTKAMAALVDAQEATRKAYKAVFSNRRRLASQVPGLGTKRGDFRSMPTAGPRRKLGDMNPAIAKIAWSPDATWIAWNTMPASTSMIPSSGGETVALERGQTWFGGSGTQPAFSPNRLLLVQEGPWSGGRDVKETLQGVTREYTTDRVAEIVFRRADGTGLQTLLKLNATKAGINGITRLQVAPDGRLFIGYTSEGDSGYAWIDPDTGAVDKVPVAGGTMDPDLAANGKLVVYTQKGTKKLKVRDAAGGGERDLGVIARDPAISPDGQWIAYCFGDEVRVISASGGKPGKLFSWSGVSLLSWSPLGNALAYRRFGEGEVGIWITSLK